MTADTYRAQFLCALVTGSLLLAVLVLSALRDIPVVWLSYAGHLGVAALMMIIAFAYRNRRDAAQITPTLVCCTLLILFTNVGATLNYLLVRPGTASLDPLLMRADALLGFDWRVFAGLVAQLGPVAPALGWIYNSSLFQMVLMILFLGFTGRYVALHRFVLVGVLCSCACLLVWALWPSVGPAAMIPLDPQIAARLQPVVDAQYGERLRMLLENPPRSIAAGQLIGLIAFPSMHTVMALMSVWYARGSRLLVPMIVINCLMVPAILVHGGHHLVDVFGGALVFVAGAAIAVRIVPEPARPAPSHQTQTASGGRLIRMASMLPPVFSPNSVPRS